MAINSNIQTILFDSGRASMVRSIIKDRLAAGMTQKTLADAAGVRIEKGKVTPDTATIAKIDRALKRALKPKKR